MNRKAMILLIDNYYKNINRVNPPQFRNYSNHELKQVISMFDIKINEL
jgi:hypothetical protein